MVTAALPEVLPISDQRNDDGSRLNASFFVAAKILSFWIDAVLPSVIWVKEVMRHSWPSRLILT